MPLPTDADIPLILSRIRPNAEWGWMGGAFSNPANLNWRDQVQIEPTLVELDAEWTVILSEQATELTVKQALKADYLPLVGRPVSALTNSELRTLIEIYAFILGGVDSVTRNLLPPNKWEVAKELLDV